MINLVQNSPSKIAEYHGDSVHHAGLLRTPNSGNRIENALALGMKWAMDNGCYKQYEPEKIIAMMRRFQGLPDCLFMVAPDVVCDHDATLLLFRAWLGTIQSYGYPIAFVIQNGATPENIPFSSIDAIFIGGDNLFKYSQVVRDIVKKAKQLGKWVHMGRANTPERIHYSKSIECDSFDGTGFSIAPRDNIKKNLAFYTGLRQKNLWELL